MNQPSQATLQEPKEPLEVRIAQAGEALVASLGQVLRRTDAVDSGPGRMASILGIDKVLASRLLKTIRAPDGMTALHRAPGPEPIRRVLRAVAQMDVPPEEVAAAEAATNEFEKLIKTEARDRTALDTILSTWVPEARRVFEMRRRQSAFRAISQLKGVQAGVFAETAIFWPSSDGISIDVIWMKSVSGLALLRPGVQVKFTSVRNVLVQSGRHPVTLSGGPVQSASNTVLSSFSSTPSPELTGEVAGEHTHYLMTSLRLGEPVRLVTCEVNRSEMNRFASASRRGWASSEIAIPTQVFQFDLLLHPDLFSETHPDLRVYDTAVRGLADRNDPSRDIDQFDLLDRIDELGSGLAKFGSDKVPQYRRLLGEVTGTLGLDGSSLRGYRVSSDYPLYGSQYVMSFPTTEK